MLQQIVLTAPVYHHIVKHFTDNVQLVESREDDRFRNLLSWRSAFFCCSFFVFFFLFCFNKHEFTDDFKHGVFLEDIIPHVMNTILIFQDRVSGTGINAFTLTHIKRQEECSFAVKLGCHIHFFQIHRKRHQDAGFESEEPCLRISFCSILQNCVLVVLAGCVAF